MFNNFSAIYNPVSKTESKKPMTDYHNSDHYLELALKQVLHTYNITFGIGCVRNT